MKKVKAMGSVKRHSPKKWTAQICVPPYGMVILYNRPSMKDAIAEGNRIAKLLGWEIDEWVRRKETY